MFILLKLHYAKFYVSRCSIQKLLKTNLWGVGSTPPPLAKGSVKANTAFSYDGSEMITAKCS